MDFLIMIIIVLVISGLLFSIMHYLKQFFILKDTSAKGDSSEYLYYIEKGKFKDKFCYGISDKKRGFQILDPVMQPGALYCGGMGSGKSVSMRFTLVTHVAVNSENTLYILMDAMKSMTDYAILFNGEHIDLSQNVVTALKDDAKIVPLIDIVHQEAMLRNEAFSKVSATNIYDYERIMKKKNPAFPGLARIVIAIEEFHVIPNSPYVRFMMKVDQPGSIADKMKVLMRIGRSYGIFFLFATQRATGDDIPTQLRPGITMMMCFKMNNPGEAAGMNLPHAQEITMEQRGRCAYEEGFIQFPYLPDNSAIAVLKRYYKPLKAGLLGYSVAQIKESLESEGTSGMVRVKPLLEILNFSNQYNSVDIITRILNTFKYTVEKQPNVAYVAELIAEKYGKRYAVKVVSTRTDLASQKEVDALKKGAEYLGCDGAIVIGLEALNSQITRLEQSDPKKYKVLDPDDLKNIGRMVDNKKDLDLKNTYNEIYLGFPLADERDLFVVEPEIVASDYSMESIEASGQINDPKKMKELLFDKQVNIQGMTDEIKQSIIKRLKISAKTKFIELSFLKEKKLYDNISYMKELLKEPNNYVVGLSDEDKDKIINMVEEPAKLEEKIVSNMDFLDDFFVEDKGKRKQPEPIVFDEDEIISVLEQSISETVSIKDKAKKQRASLAAAKEQVVVSDQPKQIVNAESIIEIRERLKKSILASNN